MFMIVVTDLKKTYATDSANRFVKTNMIRSQLNTFTWFHFSDLINHIMIMKLW